MRKYIIDLIKSAERKEQDLTKIFYWVLTSPAITFFNLFIEEALRPVEDGESLDNLLELYEEQDFLEARIKFEDRLQSNIGTRDCHIYWRRKLSIVFENKIRSLPSGRREVNRSDPPSADDYWQIERYFEETQKDEDKKFVISITPDNNDLNRLRENLRQHRTSVFWTSWNDVRNCCNDAIRNITSILSSEIKGRISNRDLEDLITEYSRLKELIKAIDSFNFTENTTLSDPAHRRNPTVWKWKTRHQMKVGEYTREIFEKRNALKTMFHAKMVESGRELLSRKEIDEIICDVFPNIEWRIRHKVIHGLVINSWTGFIQKGITSGVALFLDNFPEKLEPGRKGRKERYSLLPIDEIESIAGKMQENRVKIHRNIVMKLHTERRYPVPDDWDDYWDQLKRILDRRIQNLSI